MAITTVEFSTITQIVGDSIRQAVEPLDLRLGVVEKQLNDLINNIDQFLCIVQRHE